MKLSRTVAYALQATLQLARSEDASVPIPCNRLAADGGMPERFLLQILRNLVNHGVLTSHRGVEGGYSLERKPSDVSLLEVIEAVDGPFAASLSQVYEGLPAGSRSKVESVFKDVAESIRHKLRAITLAHLLPSERDR
jgi:Rrf2 family protein